VRLWQRRFDEAEALEKSVLETRQRFLGPDHPWVSQTLADIGYILSFRGQCERAIPYLERSRELNERTLGRDHSLVADPTHILGTCLVEVGRVDEGRKRLRETVAIFDAVGMSPEHCTYQRVLRELAEIDEKVGTGP
ncbi:MAG TPA: tetratricopeptide repeat protein, partial [Thermoanaerobaculia bacterium]|nr:tetratricopeptide repeat protein [Thermoanaerobaculia bacterium]